MLKMLPPWPSTSDRIRSATGDPITIMSPLQLNTTCSGSWDCITCTETYNTAQDQPWETSREGALVCAGCTRHQFEKAVQFDYNWPARFGSEALDVSDFKSILPTQLFAALTQKAEEMAAMAETPSLEAVENLTRSKDYQLCPGCKKIIFLQDGCNHVTCVCCMSQFCWICLEEVKDAEQCNHWAVGICPRYGPLGSDMFDTLVEDRLPTEEEEAAADRLHMIRWAAFRLDSWAWSVAMQSLEDDNLGQGLRFAQADIVTGSRALRP